jgi:MoaA/NifB/PqqE/SkfB family radical SAM enzyme
MNVEREEPWGRLIYDAANHRFDRYETNRKGITPYAQQPVVLNVDLTMKCNMDCLHCVTKDFGKTEDLVVSKKLIEWINRSDFMVVVVTGGEPFLPEYENQLLSLLRGIRRKGLIIDTNGTILPSEAVIHTILDKRALVRISWDSVRPYDEIPFRHVKPDTKKNREINCEYFTKKVDMIQNFRRMGVNVAIQSVVHRENLATILLLPEKMQQFQLNRLYLQRFIPSHKAADRKFDVNNDDYDRVTAELTERCLRKNIQCITKKDRRHNCVVLLVGDGLIYTQGDKPGEKVFLGTIDSNIRYFDYISSADHAERYYG